MKNGKWSVGNKEWRMGNGVWGIKNEEWEMECGE